MSTRLVLCRLSEIANPGAKGFVVTLDGEKRGVFVVRKGEQVFGYVNSCPHRASPLDWKPDTFLDSSGHHILCANHGALFHMEDGLCVAGPCLNKSLEPFPVIVENGVVVKI